MDTPGKGSSVVQDVITSGRPALVTKDGLIVAAIVDVDTYTARREEVLGQSLAADFKRVSAQVQAGDVITRDEMVRRIQRRFHERVSARVRRQLDRL